MQCEDGAFWRRPKFVEVDAHFGLPEFNAMEIKGDPEKQGIRFKIKVITSLHNASW